MRLFSWSLQVEYLLTWEDHRDVAHQQGKGEWNLSLSLLQSVLGLNINNARAGRDSGTNAFIALTRVGSTQSSPASKKGVRALLQNTWACWQSIYIWWESAAAHGKTCTERGISHCGFMIWLPHPGEPTSSNRKHLLTEKALKKIQ